MMHAYDQTYLSDVMRNLGGMLDFAVNDCHFAIDAFLKIFVISGVAEQIEKGNPRYLSGYSGEELVWIVAEKTGIQRKFPEAEVRYDRTPEYWCGWISAYYQWESGDRFRRIYEACPGKELLELYPAVHEASEQKAAEVLNKRMRAERSMTQLQRLRKYAHLTQAALAKKAGVSLRSVQMYEQRQKDINRAQAETIFRLSSVLDCRPEDLLE